MNYKSHSFKTFLLGLAIMLVMGATQAFAVTVDIQLRDSDNNAVTNAGTATLKVYDNGWTTLTNSGGDWSYTTNSTTVKFKMYFNNGIQQKTVSTSTSPVVFNTVTVTPALKDSDDNELSGGKLKYYQNGWTGYKTANEAIEMLAGTYKFKMYYNNGIEYKNNHEIDGNNDAQVVLFQTVTVDPALKASDGTALSGGKFKFYQNGWSGYNDANVAIEMLAGTYKFKMYYNNGIEYKNNHEIDGNNDEQVVLFQTVTVDPALKASDGTALSGGKFKFYQNGWSGYNNANVAIEMLAGTYKFKMYYNNGIQYKNNEAILGTNTEQVVLFQTVTVDPALKASDGTALSGGKFKFYQNGWSGYNTANTPIEMLAGTYKFKMYYNNGIQYKNNEAILGTNTEQEVLFQTTTVTHKLTNCDNGNEVTGGKVKHYQNGWSGYNTANTEIEYLPGSYKFKMYYKNGIEYQNNVAVSGESYDVEFFTRTVDYNYAETVKFYQNGWRTHNGPEEILEGEYKFKFGNIQKYITISNCLISTQSLNEQNSLSLSGNVYIFKVKNEAGDGVANIPIKWHYNTNYDNTYKDLGKTDSDGMLFSIGDVTKTGNQPFKAVLNQTSQRKETSDYTEFQTATATALVKDHSDNPLEGKEVRFQYHSGYSNLYVGLGNTDAEGKASVELFPGDYNFKAFVNKTSSEKTFTLSYSTPVDITFQTELATALVQNCELGAIPGVLVEFLWHNSYTGSGYRINVGTTGNDGKASIELFESDNLKFRAKINHTYSLKTFDLEPGVDVDVEFNPTLVDLDYAGDVEWKYNNYYYTDVTDDYLMFPGTYKFKFSGVNDFTGIIDLDISGCEFGSNVYIFEVVNEDGEGIAGVPIEWHYNTNYNNTWKNIGTTDADGMLYSFGDVTKDGSQPFRAKYNKTSQTKSTVGYAKFQTTVATALVQNCEQGPISGVNVDFLWHGNYTGNNWRINLGTTGTDGKASIEIFPGNHKFEAKLNHTTSVKTFDLVANEDVDVEFNPTLVDLDYAGTVKWKYNNYYYTDVTDDYLMFPGTYKFKFSGVNDFTGIIDLDISGCEFGSNVYIFEVVNEDGEGIAGVPIEWHYNTNYSNTWKNIGTTDADGMLYSFGDVTKDGSQPFRAKYNKTSQTKSTVGYAKFQTTVATALVQNCEQGPISGVNVDFLWHGNYTGSNWRINLGTTGTDGKASIEIFPGNHKFEAKLNHTTSVKTFDLAPNEDVDVEFNPTKVNFNYAGTVKWKYNNYYYTDVTPDYLMFPGTYKFKFSGVNDFTGTYDLDVSGCEMEKAPIFVQLKNSLGNGLSNGTFDYRFGYGGYTNIGTDNTGDGIWYFLDGNPSKTRVKITYDRGSLEKRQNVQTNPRFIFNTVLITAGLKDSDGNDITGSATWKYRYNLETARSLNPVSGVEVLPIGARVNVTYKRASVEKKKTVSSSNRHFTFNTVKVTATLTDQNNNDITDNATWKYRYNLGSYYTFNPNGEEMLPSSPKIQATYASQSKVKQQDVGSSPHYNFTWNGNSLSKQFIYDIADGWNGVSTNVYPNPFSETVTVDYNVHEDSNVQINVHNSNGEFIKQLVNTELPAGGHSIVWDGKLFNGQNAANGIYIITVKAGDSTKIIKVSLSK